MGLFSSFNRVHKARALLSEGTIQYKFMDMWIELDPKNARERSLRTACAKKLHGVWGATLLCEALVLSETRRGPYGDKPVFVAESDADEIERLLAAIGAASVPALVCLLRFQWTAFPDKRLLRWNLIWDRSMRLLRQITEHDMSFSEEQPLTKIKRALKWVDWYNEKGKKWCKEGVSPKDFKNVLEFADNTAVEKYYVHVMGFRLK